MEEVSIRQDCKSYLEQRAMNTKNRKSFLSSLKDVEEILDLDKQVAHESQADQYDREYDYSNRDNRTSSSSSSNNNNNNNDDDNNNNSDTSHRMWLILYSIIVLYCDE